MEKNSIDEELNDLISESEIQTEDVTQLMTYGFEATKEILTAYIKAREFNPERTLYPGEFIAILKKESIIGDRYNKDMLNRTMGIWQEQRRVIGTQTFQFEIDPGFSYSSLRHPEEETDRALMYLDKIVSEGYEID